MLVLVALLGASGPLTAQARQAPPIPPAVQVGDVAAAGVGAALVLAPRVFGWGRVVPDCSVPCDPATLPFFDRWALSPISTPLSRGSDVLLVALGIGTVATTLHDDRSGRELVSALQAGLWAESATELLKVGFGRERPVLYTQQGVGAETNKDNLRSFPSGHTSVAFALATSLWLAERDMHGRPGLVGWLGFVGATGIGVLRVAAGKHFPSDVFAGAVLGTATALTVHAIKF
jgi:membrane-associated phospholipid phosphatase